MPNYISEGKIKAIMDESTYDIRTVFGKCTVVSMRLPNGYVLVESSGCVDPERYNEEYGAELCVEQLEHRVWQLYGFALQEDVFKENAE